MRRAALTAAVPALILAAVLAGAASAQTASPAPTGAAKITETQIAAPARTAIGADQVSAPASSAAVGTQQLSQVMRTTDAPVGPGTVADSRDTSAAPIKGRDHCDAPANAPVKAECAQILDSRADNFATAQPEQPAPVDTQTSSTNLVDTIVNGGTGTVVTLPPPK